MFKPFATETDSSAVHDLTFENQFDHINIYGNLQISKDQQGLAVARKLAAFFNDMVKELEQQTDLAEKIEIKDADEVENPFL
ncbi:hypothetical protein [Acinetobacter rudis]|uniref:Uncharacterized protein n=1 Tax=Acinetobacter rudis CIP 110305 TaxID=421052 RepID=S3MRW0_9GAMM|nr:hypothetical protein [Acinetobacter rudis]EPF70352.1 hypothetical protein F945_03373 [Acinetobacter rudis CIP 110305]